VALKKPGDLFAKKRNVIQDTSPNVNESISKIRNQFSKVDELKKQLEDVSSSINESLSEVVDNNVNVVSLQTQYNEVIQKLNKKIDRIKEEFSNEVKALRKSHSNLTTEVTIIEKRQRALKINDLKENIIVDVQNLLKGDVFDNIKHLENRVNIINEKHVKLLTESYNEPPSVDNSDPLTPLDKNFVNLQDFQEHYRLFLNRIQRQLSTLGGGGAVLISDLDDVDTSTAKVDNKFLKYNAASGKWVGSDTAGGGYTLPTASANTLGGIKIGSGLSIDGNGVVTASGGGGGGSQNLFSTIAVSGQSNVVADSTSDTLSLVAGSNMQITTNASGDSITFASTGGGGGSQNVFSTIAVSGQNNVVADSTTDTLTLVAGSNMTITTNDSSDTITFASTGGSTLTTEEVQDIVGAMFSGNTETNITATYQDSDGTIDLIVSGGLSDVVADTSPQLGGNLDVQAREINTSTTNGNIKLTPNGTGVVEVRGAGGNDGTLQLNCSAQSHGIKLKSPPHSAGASYTLTFPNNIVDGQFLKTDSSGNLSWASGSLSSRSTTSATTGSISQAASTNLTIPTAGKSFSLLSLTISAPAYVILYVDTTTRSADSSRSEGTDPAPGSGVITEVSTTASGSTTFLMTPAVLGWNNDSTPAAQIYAKVVNKRATSGSNAITVTLKTVALEA
tara:strand:- start:1831 stop:3855 length:2025 start_codon:yes stop_codon:yes gene_type:complete